MGPYDSDNFLVFHDSISPDRLAKDIGKSERWVKGRITLLKNCGAWDVIKCRQAASSAFDAAYFVALKQDHFIELDGAAVDRAKIALGQIDIDEVSW